MRCSTASPRRTHGDERRDDTNLGMEGKDPELVEGSQGRGEGFGGLGVRFDVSTRATQRRLDELGVGGRTRGLLRLRGGARGDGRHPRAPGAREHRVLVTNDEDFGEQVFREGRPHGGIVLLRRQDGRPMNQVRKLSHFLRWYADRLPNGFTVVREAGVRFAGDRVGHGRTEDRGTEISDDRFQGKLGAVRMQARRPRSHWAGGSSWARGST